MTIRRYADGDTTSTGTDTRQSHRRIPDGTPTARLPTPSLRGVDHHAGYKIKDPQRYQQVPRRWNPADDAALANADADDPENYVGAGRRCSNRR
jgi:hypothetical protein